MTTTLAMYYWTAGMADRQVAEQFGEAFADFVARDDPGWGEVVIAAGMHGDIFTPHRGDLNLYWWWSGSEDEGWLEHYCRHALVRPDIILCTSFKMEDHARARGYRAIYLPMATGREFYPLDLPRSGTAYCGTEGHKNPEQVRCIIEPARAYGFEWWTWIPGGRVELNERYNRTAVCLGMTADISLGWGIVPNRAFDVLAGDTPYLTYTHWGMEAALGMAYPYQSASPEETARWLDELIHNAGAHRQEFADYGAWVRREHTWDKRMEMLQAGLA